MFSYLVKLVYNILHPWPNIEIPKYAIYALQLENNKYYVGKTLDINTRIRDHFDGSGSAWTQKYKPIEIHAIKYNCDSFDEDKYVKIMMARYGIFNVRGGSYSKINLDTYSIDLLEKEINGAVDNCFNCGKKHFIDKCPALQTCYRCGRTNHYSNKCYAKTDVTGKLLA